MGVQEVRLGKEGTARAGDYTFFFGKGEEKSSTGDRIFRTPENNASNYESNTS